MIAPSSASAPASAPAFGIQAVQHRQAPQNGSPPANNQAQDIARNLLKNTTTASGHDLARVNASLTTLSASNPELGGNVRAAVNSQLSTTEQSQLAAVARGDSSGVDTGALALDLTQMALDIVGIFEPTPFADGSNAIISIFRGEWGQAGLSALGIIPYLGDAAKLGKLGKWAKTLTNAIEAAASNPAVRKAIEPALKKVADALNSIPQSVLDKLPASARDQLTAMKTKLDDFLKTASGSFSAAVTNVAQRLGIDPAKVQSVLDLGKGSRPDPASYLPASRIADHAAAFQDGASRFTLKSSLDKYGLGQRDGTSFVMTRAEADKLLAQTGGDPRKLEQALGLPTGQLDGDSLVRVDFKADAMDDLNVRIPSGNEAGANDQWLPGGLLPSGANEAVLDGAKANASQYTTTVIN